MAKMLCYKRTYIGQHPYLYSSHHSSWLIIKMHSMSLLCAPTSVRYGLLPWTRLTFMGSTERPSAKKWCAQGWFFGVYLAINRAIDVHGSSRLLLTSNLLCLAILYIVDCCFYYGQWHSLGVFGLILTAGVWHAIGDLLQHHSTVCFEGMKARRGLFELKPWPQRSYFLQLKEAVVILNRSFWEEFWSSKPANNVVSTNGSFDKIAKFWGIWLFCDGCHSCQGRFRALVTANASNIGINKHSIVLQACFEWPRNLLTFFLERDDEDLTSRG